MDTRAYLSLVVRYDRMIENKLKEISKLRSIICGTSAMQNGGDRIQTTKNPDKISSYVAKIVDMEHDVDRIIDERYEIVQEIESIPDTNMYDVLCQKYILDKEMKTIRLRGDVSLKQVKRIYYDALSVFENMYGNKYLEAKCCLEIKQNVPKTRQNVPKCP